MPGLGVRLRVGRLWVQIQIQVEVRFGSVWFGEAAVDSGRASSIKSCPFNVAGSGPTLLACRRISKEETR